jgi:hypothetical protein
MLQRPLRQVLPLRDVQKLGVSLDHAALDAALAKLNGETQPDRAAADDDDLVCVAHD